MEYVLIAIVAGLVVLVALSRFSGSVSGRWQNASERVEQAKAGGRASGETANFDPTSGGGPTVASSKAASASAATEDEAPTQRPVDPAMEGKVKVARFTIDISMLIWLGVLVVAVTAMIALRAFAAAKKKPKVKV